MRAPVIKARAYDEALTAAQYNKRNRAVLGLQQAQFEYTELLEIDEVDKEYIEERLKDIAEILKNLQSTSLH